MHKWILFVLFIGAGVLGLGIIFQQISERQAATASEANAGKQLKIVASNWKFDQAEYTVTKGEAMKVALVLKEGVHAINIKGEGVDITLDKNTPSQQVKFDKPGTYELHCVLPCGTGHADMKSKITVQ